MSLSASALPAHGYTALRLATWNPAARRTAVRREEIPAADTLLRTVLHLLFRIDFFFRF